MKQLLYIFSIAVVALCACDRRKNVLSRDELEDVLYDYHVMQALIDQLPDSMRERQAQDYINAVFEKHYITEAQFDSSITYYNRHTKDLAKIYSSLRARFSEATEAMQLQTGNNDLNAMFANGDTANVWAGSKMIQLCNKDMMRSESYSILCDTSCHKRDQFTLMFTPLFINNKNDGRGGTLTAGLGIVYKGGKTVGITQQIPYTNPQRLTLKAADTLDIAKVNIFFYYKSDGSGRDACIVNDISLVQMHEKPQDVAAEAEKADTAATKTVAADTITLDTAAPTRMLQPTPEDIRRENKPDRLIKIETAPAVRHPNSIGPRRKPAKAKPDNKR